MPTTLRSNRGSLLLVTLLTTAILLAILGGMASVAVYQKKAVRQKVAEAQALYVAEAGVNYYRWALYHKKEEYCNETCIGAPDYGPYGPYTYEDSSGQNISGSYELYITPPPTNGSIIVTVRSIGWVNTNPNVKKTIEVKVGIPSWSTYSTLANANMRFGSGTEVWGPIHSNGGVRFDGIAHDIVSSALLDYDDPDHSGPNEFGVHTHISPIDPYPDGNNPPQNVPARPDVFSAGRSFPLPVVSFDLLDTYVTDTLLKAESNGIVLENSGAEGYHITFNTDDTMDIRTVTAVSPDCIYCLSGWGWWCWQWESSHTDKILSEVNYDMGTSTPPNGIVFVKDKVWVDGKIDTNRVTVLAFAEPIGGSISDIIINNDLTYTNYDGSDILGLIAQHDISVGLYSEDNLQIDAALIAKEGRIGRNYFPKSNANNCSKLYSERNTITINGSLATRNRYGFAWTDGTGYDTRNLNYDTNLTFDPPPHFPTTGEYTFISWEEK